MTPFTLRTVNADVHSVHTATGAHIGNLKRVGAVWKFKAIGYDDAGRIEPGGGPLTHLHNTPLAAPDEAELNAKLATFAIR
ncbi:MAG: hypothetical protein RL032_1886 [Pseudomonadota bacterium]|jgi:hypothetical protein